MAEFAEIIIGICILIAVYVLTRRVHAWRMRQAYLRIMKDLENKGAFDNQKAVPLPYAKKNVLRVGMRDYRPRTLEYLVTGDIVGITEDGRYYLKDRQRDPSQGVQP